jgi:hypothetical protein
VAILTSNAEALPEPKVAITYSLKTADCLTTPHDDICGAYWQDISGTPFGLGDVEFVCDTLDSLDPSVTVTTADPLEVTIEYTLDEPGGIIIDGPVELTQTDFGRDFVLNVATTVTTLIDTELFLKGTGTLSGSANPPATITWDNVVSPYEEAVLGSSNCEGGFCDLAGPWPKDLSTYTPPAPPVGRVVVLPTFTVFANSVFADEFASDNGTPNDPSDDIDRPDDNATVNDTWYGVEVVPEPSGEILLMAGVLGLAGLCRLRERGGVSALFTSRH